MEIIKKHILSVVCGVVALVAVVLAFWPLGSMKEAALAELDSRASRYSQIQSLRTRQRHLPIVDMGTSEAPLLAGFPTEKAIEKAMALSEKLAAEKNAVILAAEESNRRELLVPQSLPNAVGTTSFEFKERYLKTIAAFPRLMAAGQPPTAAEIDAAKAALWETQYKPNIILQNGVADPISEADQKKAFDREVLDLPEKEKYKRAEQIKVYIAPDAVQPSIGVATTGGQAPSRKTIWYAQLNLWLQTDIASAISAANAPYRSVVAAPVKNWISLRIDPYRLGAAVASGAAGGYPGAPAPVAATGSGEPRYDLSPTAGSAIRYTTSCRSRWLWTSRRARFRRFCRNWDATA
jgi:O6-methylguanine-DNA--protein-cysteine methyltransferase